MTSIVISLLICWFIFSVANQHPMARRWIPSAIRSLFMLPSLSLFAPEPIDVDYHLLWRDIATNGTVDSWRELNMNSVSPLRALWNPSGRDFSALIQVTSQLSLLANASESACRTGQHVILVSLPYLFLLNAVAAQPRSTGAADRQFMIVETRGFGADRQLRLGMLSEIHALESGAGL
jgi:hypothetical protein